MPQEVYRTATTLCDQQSPGPQPHPGAQPLPPGTQGLFRGSLSFLWSGENEGTPRGSCRYPDLGSRLKRHPHLIALSFRHPPPASVCNLPAVSGLSYWSPCVPAREQNQVNRRPGKGVRTEVRAPPQRGPQPPGRWGTCRCPLRGPQCAPRAGATLGGRWFKVRSLQTGDTEATTGTGNSCPSPQSGAAVVASPRGVRFSKKLSPERPPETESRGRG